eukprot:COSAG02_NODE_5820_length_4015_cov_24.353933_2_plen_914_part_00
MGNCASVYKGDCASILVDPGTMEAAAPARPEAEDGVPPDRAADAHPMTQPTELNGGSHSHIPEGDPLPAASMETGAAQMQVPEPDSRAGVSIDRDRRPPPARATLVHSCVWNDPWNSEHNIRRHASGFDLMGVIRAVEANDATLTYLRIPGSGDLVGSWDVSNGNAPLEAPPGSYVEDCLTDSAISMLTKALHGNQHVRVLDLAYQPRLTDDQAGASLMLAIPKCAIELVRLDRYEVGDGGISLAKQAQIQQLGFLNAVKRVAQDDPALELIDWRPLAGRDDYNVWAKPRQMTPSPDRTVICELCTALRSNHHVRRIFLSDNQNLDDTVAALIEEVVPRCAVEVVDMTSTSVTPQIQSRINALCASKLSCNNPGYWRARHNEQPLQTGSALEISARVLAPLRLVPSLIAAGARCVYPSIRSLLGHATADTTGFALDIAVLDVSTTGGLFCDVTVVAASYRWEEVSQRSIGSRMVTMPSNNAWFVRYLEDHQLLGWLDFVAHDFGLLLDTVLPQMGKIYSTFTVVPQYLLNPVKTLQATTRGWIFQESAFTRLEQRVVDKYVLSLNEVVDWLFCSGALPVWASCPEDVATALEGFAAIYERRCQSIALQLREGIIDCCSEICNGEPPGDCATYPFDDVALRGMIRDFAGAAKPLAFRVHHGKDTNRNPNPDRILVREGSNHMDLVTSLGRTDSARKLNAPTRCMYVLSAFASLEFSNEEDCVVGVLAQIAYQHFGVVLQQDDVDAAHGLLKFLWEQQLDASDDCVAVVSAVRRTTPRLTTIGLGALHLHQLCSSSMTSSEAMQDNFLVKHISSALRIPLNGALWAGWSQRSLVFPLSAQKHGGFHASAGIRIMVLGNDENGVYHLAVYRGDDSHCDGSGKYGDGVKLFIGPFEGNHWTFDHESTFTIDGACRFG